MNKNPWIDTIKTKTFWVGIVTVLAGLVEGVFVSGEPQFNLSAIFNEKTLMGLGLIFGRHAITKL